MWEYIHISFCCVYIYTFGAEARCGGGSSQKRGEMERCYNAIIHGYGVLMCEGVAVADSKFVCLSTASRTEQLDWNRGQEKLFDNRLLTS